ncbi:MAG: quinolinate synthase NadA [Candidatus Diapherotrites archaeon]|nr:quinolinate synthase NadA [Candidatus Diapherotrites archaeon]
MQLQFSKEINKEAKRLHSKLKYLNYSLNDCLPFAPFTLEINRLKLEKNAVILAHNYQRAEIIYGIADYHGDSLGLSRQAKETGADTIVFCGVHFMAETAKILSPKKKVLIPDHKAGCSLSESITSQDVLQLRKKYPHAGVVTYVNTSAEVKAESDVVCTSANALKIIEEMPQKEIIFLPDTFMAQNLAKKTAKKIIPWHGTCIVHETFSPEQIDAYRGTYPDIKVLAHTECKPEVVAKADLAGGTSDMSRYVQNSSAGTFMLVTECGMSDMLQVQFPHKKFVVPCAICPHMKKINLENILASLKEDKYEIIVEENVGCLN